MLGFKIAIVLLAWPGVNAISVDSCPASLLGPTEHKYDDGLEQSQQTSGNATCGSLFIRLGAAPLSIEPQVRNHPSFPDSHLPLMPPTLGGGTEDFPAVMRYSGKSEAKQAGIHLRQLLDEHLAHFGAVMIKGFPVQSPSDFSELMHATGLTLVDYVGGVTSRPVIAPKVTPTSEESSDIAMELHNDDPYWEVPPTMLAMYAQLPAKEGGEGLIGDGRKVLAKLKEEYPQVLEEFRNRSLRYEHFYPDADAFDGEVVSSWQIAFASDCDAATGCNQTKAAEQKLADGGFGFEWTSDGLKKWEVTNPVLKHPVTGEETWMNQVSAMHCSVFDNHPAYPELNRAEEAREKECTMRGAMPYHTTFGDGSPISVQSMHAVRDAQWKSAVAFNFEAGDIVVLDNYFSMHGRFSFKPPRELFLTMIV